MFLRFIMGENTIFLFFKALPRLCGGSVEVTCGLLSIK